MALFIIKTKIYLNGRIDEIIVVIEPVTVRLSPLTQLIDRFVTVALRFGPRRAGNGRFVVARIAALFVTDVTTRFVHVAVLVVTGHVFIFVFLIFLGLLDVFALFRRQNVIQTDTHVGQSLLSSILYHFLAQFLVELFQFLLEFFQEIGVLTGRTEPIAFGDDQERGPQARTVPTLVATVTQQNPFGVVAFAALLTRTIVDVFFHVGFCREKRMST